MSSLVEWASKPWYIYLMEYYSICSFHISAYHVVVICYKKIDGLNRISDSAAKKKNNELKDR